MRASSEPNKLFSLNWMQKITFRKFSLVDRSEKYPIMPSAKIEFSNEYSELFKFECWGHHWMSIDGSNSFGRSRMEFDSLQFSKVSGSRL